MRDIDDQTQKELLKKNWMTHDGMWFRHCLAECGIEATNRVNQAAIRSVALLEIKRLAQAMELEGVSTRAELRQMIDNIFPVVKGDFMDFTYGFDEKGEMMIEMHSCFARDGVERMGVLDQYQCGIYLRIDTWLEGLGIAYQAAPAIDGCMMRTGGKCHRVYSFDLPA